MLCCFQGSVQGLLGPAASRCLSTHAQKSLSAIFLLKGGSKPRSLNKDEPLNIYHYRELITTPTGPLVGAAPISSILHAGRCKGVFTSTASTPPATRVVGCLFFSSRNHVSPTSRSSKRSTSGESEAPQSDSQKVVLGNASTSQSPSSQDSTPTYSAGRESMQRKGKEIGSKEPTSANPEETLRVSLWDLLPFMQQEKFRMAAILFALLLSSAAQLLLPVAVGQLIDAMTLSPLQKQQHNKRELMQGDASSSTQEDDVLTEAQAEAAGTEASVESHQEAVKKAEDILGRRAFLESLSEVFKTPSARVGFCAFLGAVGAATSFMRLYLLESTVSGGKFMTIAPCKNSLYTDFHIERVACRLRSSLLRQLLYQSLHTSQHQKLGALVKHLSQDVVTTSRILIDLSFGLRCLTTSVVGIALCWTIAPLSFLLSLLLPISVAAFLLRVSGKQVSALQQKHSKALQGALQRATVALGARKQLRSLNAEAYELKAFDSALSGVYAAARKSAAAVGCRYAFVFAAASGLLVHLVYSAANLVAQGVLTGGQVMSLALYSALVGSSLQGCATAWSDTSRALAAAAEMLQQLMRGPPKALATPFSYEAERHRYQVALRQLQTGAAAETISPDRRGPSIEFRDVWFSYPEREKHWALKGIDFTVPPGAKVAILGPSGSGKSSLGALLLRLYEPQRGAIHIGGLPVTPVTQESLLVGQDSLQESILYAQKAHQEITGEALINIAVSFAGYSHLRGHLQSAASSSLALNAACDAACVTSFVSALPEGLKTPLDEKVAVLSGGQRQRVCLAMALYRLGQSQRSSEKTTSRGDGGDTDCSESDIPRLPTVLLLDEATSSLDAATEHQVLHNLKRVMDGGRLIQFGRKEDVLSRPCPPLQWLVSGAMAESRTGEQPL
ncbi:hypothetical protein Emed_001384 [Eimeria media]